MSGGGIDAGVVALFLYMAAFMDTTATIPTGAMAERWKWGSFVIWGFFCGAIYYPLFAAWTWGGGWLSKTWDTMSLGAGYVDFAGSGVVHTVGGVGGARRGARSRAHGSASSAPTASHARSPATTSRWRCSARSSCCSVGSGSTPHRRSPRPTSSSPIVAANTAIAGAFGAIIAMLWVTQPDRQARPGDDGQRHARRPRRHHRAVCVRVAGDGGGHRHHRRRPRDRGRVVHRAQAEDRRPGRRDRRPRRQRHVRRAGRRPVRQRQLRRRLERLQTSRASRACSGAMPDSSSPSCSARSCMWTVIFGIAYAFFRIQDTMSKSCGKGGIRSKEADEIVGLDEPRDGRARLPRVPRAGGTGRAGAGAGAGVRRLSGSPRWLPSRTSRERQPPWRTSHGSPHGCRRRRPLPPRALGGARPDCSRSPATTW